ncbi:MAG: hypothetical protein EOO40_00855, partial [Deltaproteobacteria bacterium]
GGGGRGGMPPINNGPPPAAGGGGPFYGGRNGYGWAGGGGIGGMGGGGSGAGGGGKSGAFTQGFLQGALPSDLFRMIDRGPGATRQAAGMMVGNFAKSAASAPFNGAAGLTQLAGSIPLVGGAVGGLMARSFAQVGTALGSDRQEQSLAPYLGMYGQRPSVETDARNVRLPAGQIPPEYAARFKGLGVNDSPLTAPGRELAGMSFTESQSFAGSMARASGRSLDNRTNQGMYQTALAASTAYGIGPEVAGQFSRMARQGNVSSRGTQGEAGFRRVLGQARGLGLEGQDLQEYVGRAGAGAATFDQTGYSPNQKDIGSYAQSFAAMGMGGARAGNSAAGFANKLQGIGLNGPQDEMDLLIEQVVGGYKGGGIDDSEDAERRLREGFGDNKEGRQKAGAAGMDLFRQLYQGAGGGKLGHRQALRGLRRAGIQVNDKDVDTLEANIDNPNYAGSKAFQSVSQQGLAGDARSKVSGITKTEAQLGDQANDLGHAAASIVQSMEKTANNLATRMGDTVNPYLERIAKGIETISNPGHSFMEMVKEKWKASASLGASVAQGYSGGKK